MLLFVLPIALAADCSLQCATHCLAPFNDVSNCLSSYAFTESWRNSTLTTLTTALENYGFRDLMRNTGPPYNIKLDLIGELNNLWTQSFDSDLAFQEAVQGVLQRPMDAHTRYSKPECYDATFAQPFSFNVTVVAGEVAFFLEENVVSSNYTSVIAGSATPSHYFGQRVVALDGLEVVTALTNWADQHVDRANDQAIRFNVAVRDFLFRNQRNYRRPTASSLTYTLESGEQVSFEWLGIYGPKLGVVDTCTVKKTNKDLETPHTRIHVEPAPELQSHLLRTSDRHVIIPSNSTSTVSCFVSSKNDRTTLVLKLGSFMPPGDDYIVAWKDFLGDVMTCLSVKYDQVVVDVVQNGGGYVCLGLRTLTLLVEAFHDNPDLVQMNYDLIHSPIMNQFVEQVNLPQPYWDPGQVEQIMDPKTKKPFADGKSYYYGNRSITQGGVTSPHTNIFWLDCHEALDIGKDFRPTKFASPKELYVITDGTCGSTCASFSKILQEAAQGTLVGLGGLWHQAMDVASFAGGFVCNAGYLNDIAKKFNSTFPQFETTVRWQFDWAVWYSKLQPTRPIQFTFQPSDLRIPFWAFPHASVAPETTTALVSKLYDHVIDMMSAQVPSPSPSPVPSCKHHSDGKWGHPWQWLVALVVLAVIGTATFVFCMRSKRSFGNASSKVPLV